MPAGALRERARDGGGIPGEVRERIMAVGDPFAVAMATLVERVCGRAGAAEMLGGAPPGVARLAAAMQQKHRLSAVAIDIGHQPVAGGALEHCGSGLEMLHGRSCKNLTALALNTLSPTASM